MDEAADGPLREVLELGSGGGNNASFLKRHFAAELSARGVPLIYRRDEPSLSDALTSTLASQRFEAVVLTQPGDWRVEQSLGAACAHAGVALEVRDDRHFLCSTAEFAAHAKGRKQLRMEYFYREMRKRHGVLTQGDEPEGGNWNYDVENRKGFGAKGPGLVPPPTRFEPDEITAALCAPATPYYGLACANVLRRPVFNSLPQFQAPRMKVSIPESPSLSDIVTGVGQWTAEDDADADAVKLACQTIACGTPTEYVMYGVYRCLTIKNMLAMSNPELVEAYLNRLGAAHARLAEQLLLNAMAGFDPRHLKVYFPSLTKVALRFDGERLVDLIFPPARFSGLPCAGACHFPASASC